MNFNTALRTFPLPLPFNYLARWVFLFVFLNDPEQYPFLCNSNPSRRCHVRVALQRGQMAGKVTVTVGWDSRAKFRQIWASERLELLG